MSNKTKNTEKSQFSDIKRKFSKKIARKLQSSKNKPAAEKARGKQADKLKAKQAAEKKPAEKLKVKQPAEKKLAVKAIGKPAAEKAKTAEKRSGKQSAERVRARAAVQKVAESVAIKENGKKNKTKQDAKIVPIKDKLVKDLPKARNNNAKKQDANSEKILKTAVKMPEIEGAKIRIIPLGGLDQIGMNITAFESEKSIIIVDCGMAFPDEEMPGVDLVIPDVSYLKEHQDKIEGFFITHGHEDHIGALPYVLRDMNVPVYCTRLTRGLIEIKLREHGLIESAKMNTVQFGDFVDAGDFQVEFIKTNHSIQDAAALAIHSPAGVILHTGDFKVDYTPVFGDTIDLQRFAELGKQGVLAMLCESTNAIRSGFTMSERTVGRTFENIFADHKQNRIIVATFASNVDRVQQIINMAEKYDRKVVIDGRSMINVIGVAEELGYIQIKEGTLIDISEIKNYPDDKIVLIVTGSQGESMAVLSRMASGQHRKLSLSSNDVIIMSSSPIPGNEKAVAKVINDLSRRRTKVIYQDTHVSGHACEEELKLIYALVRPKFSIPVHGELRHRLAQKDIALSLGMEKEKCILIETGDVVEISQDYCRIVDKVQAGPIMVDGLGVGDVGNVVLKDRQNLSQNGILVVSVAVEKHTGQIIAGPEIVTRGLVYVKENEEIISQSQDIVLKAIDECRRYKDLARMKNTIRNELSDYIWRRMKRTPMILPVISEV